MPFKDPDKRREYQREYMRKWYEENKEKHIRSVRKRDKKTLDWLKDYKNTLKCEVYDETHPACLEFHHIDPKTKEFSLGRDKTRLTMKAIKNEIAKCRVLCANCHRKEHYNQKEKER